MLPQRTPTVATARAETSPLHLRGVRMYVTCTRRRALPSVSATYFGASSPPKCLHRIDGRGRPGRRRGEGPTRDVTRSEMPGAPGPPGGGGDRFAGPPRTEISSSCAPTLTTEAYSRCGMRMRRRSNYISPSTSRRSSGIARRHPISGTPSIAQADPFECTSRNTSRHSWSDTPKRTSDTHAKLRLPLRQGMR